MISQYDKDMCCLYIAEGMSYIWQQKGKIARKAVNE